MSFTTNTNDIAAADGTAGQLVDRFGQEPPVLLAVWSHPDDESMLAAGLLAEVSDRGGRVVSVTATSGEHGTANPVLDPPAELADRRRRELDAALDVLGAEPAFHLGIDDGSCDRVPDRLGAGYVGSIIDQVRPDVVVSFGPDGVTGHPDHRTVGRWTQLAIADRDDRIPLIVTAAGSAWPTSCIERLHTIDAFWPGFPARPTGSHRVVVRLDDEQTDRKLAALACHASQMGPVWGALGSDGYRLLASIEAYRAANPAAHRLMNAVPAQRAA